MQRLKYNTKFSALTLSIDLEPDTYVKDRLKRGWHVMKIFNELNTIASRKHLPMVDKRTIYQWIERSNGKYKKK